MWCLISVNVQENFYQASVLQSQLDELVQKYKVGLLVLLLSLSCVKELIVKRIALANPAPKQMPLPAVLCIEMGLYRNAELSSSPQWNCGGSCYSLLLATSPKPPQGSACLLFPKPSPMGPSQLAS